MARIIRTTPKTRQRFSLRVVFSFLLFMQIQIPDARDLKTADKLHLSFNLAAKETPQLSLVNPKAAACKIQELVKTN